METYLGDGLYFQDQGFQIRLYTQRGAITHEVFLEDHVFMALLEAVSKARNITIITGKKEDSENEV